MDWLGALRQFAICRLQFAICNPAVRLLKLIPLTSYRHHQHLISEAQFIL